MRNKNRFTTSTNFQRIAWEICEKEWWAENVISQVQKTRDSINNRVENPYESYSDSALEEAVTSISNNPHINPSERREHLHKIHIIMKKREKK